MTEQTRSDYQAAQRYLVALLTVAVIALALTLGSIVVTVRSYNSVEAQKVTDRRAECRARQSSAYNEDHWVAVAKTLEGLLKDDDAQAAKFVAELVNADSVAERVALHCPEGLTR